MENLVWAAIRDANNQVGDWTLRWYATPPGEEKPDGERVGSGLRVTATNQKTGEVRTHELPGRLPRLPPALGEEYPEIFKALGLFAELWMDSPHRFFISRRSPQG